MVLFLAPEHKSAKFSGSFAPRTPGFIPSVCWFAQLNSYSVLTLPRPPTSWNCVQMSCDVGIYMVIVERFLEPKEVQKSGDYLDSADEIWGSKAVPHLFRNTLRASLAFKVFTFLMRKSCKMTFTLTLFLFYFWDRGLLCRLGLPWTYNLSTWTSNAVICRHLPPFLVLRSLVGLGFYNVGIALGR